MSHHHVEGKNLFLTIILNIIITLAQIAGGLYSGSLALLSDALHNFSDVVALVLSYVTNKMASKDSTYFHTFGYKRAEILATLFNAVTLIGIAFYLIAEAIQRFQAPIAVDSIWVIGLGLLSIIMNSFSVLLIKDDSKHNMNIRAAYLHLLTDVVTSIAVVLGGFLMIRYQLYWVDPAVTIMIAVYLMRASFSLLKDATSILMQATPTGIDIEDISNMVKSFDEIKNIHQVRVWSLNDNEIYLQAHIDFKQNLALEDVTQKISKIEQSLKQNYNITHVTLQAEYLKNDDKSLVQK